MQGSERLQYAKLSRQVKTLVNECQPWPVRHAGSHKWFPSSAHKIFNWCGKTHQLSVRFPACKAWSTSFFDCVQAHHVWIGTLLYMQLACCIENDPIMFGLILIEIERILEHHQTRQRPSDDRPAAVGHPPTRSTQGKNAQGVTFLSAWSDAHDSVTCQCEQIRVGMLSMP